MKQQQQLFCFHLAAVALLSTAASGLRQTTSKSTAKQSLATTLPPCCRDMLGSQTCTRLFKLDKNKFVEKCNANVEFRLMQCCSSCNRNNETLPYDLVAPALMSDKCFDRYSAPYCQRYVNASGVWSHRQWSCSGKNPEIAFRSCRKSCGFCDTSRVRYTLAKAVEACHVTRRPLEWRRRENKPFYLAKLGRAHQ